MNYVKITNGAVDQYPYSIDHLRRDNANVSFPRAVPIDIMRRYSMLPVIVDAIPEYDPLTHKVTTATTPTRNGNDWVITRTMVDLTSDEIADNDAHAAFLNRVTRNKLLDESDWTQMNDSPLSNELKTAWATYRQECRGLSDADAWPNLADDDWPVAP
jgi:hypothetical protein